MIKLCELDFKEFWFGDFVDDNGQEINDNCWVLQSPESKISNENSKGYWDNSTIVNFYKKGTHRWVKKMEKSSEQLLDDCRIYLMGEDRMGLPTHFQIECGNDSFDYILSDKQMHWILDHTDKDFFSNEIHWKDAFVYY